ncbi:hypothetical protein Bbelb_250260 [Branchiostoma belcheri]|nr:hypothetical protein Bbelb_250260 [Branchiostoma belcheri]
MARWSWAREEWRDSETTSLVFKDEILQDTTSDFEYQVYPEEQQCSVTCLQLMRSDKTPQLTGYTSIRCILKNSSAVVPVSTRLLPRILTRHHKIQEHQMRTRRLDWTEREEKPDFYRPNCVKEDGEV